MIRDPAGLVPPHALDSEAAVLDAVLARGGIDEVADVLEPAHFYSEANRLIFEAALGLRERLQPVDAVTVRQALQDRGCYDRMGGSRYLAELMIDTVATAHPRAAAEAVRDKWRLRQLIAACQRIAAEGYGETGDAQEFIDEAEQSVYDIARAPNALTVQPIKQCLVEAFAELGDADRPEGIVGIATGFTGLDNKTAGLQRGDLTIIAARPGMGKTSAALNMATSIAFDGWPVAVFSLEMPARQVAVRLACSEARVDLGTLRRGQLTEIDWQKLTAASAELAKLPIWIDDSPSLTIVQLRSRVRRLQAELARGTGEDGQQKKLGAVVVDYLQLMRARRERSREQEISALSRGLKHVAKELDIPVIALSQLNRACETRGKDKRPLLSDLRESGAIEQDADTIVFIYRDEYYYPDTAERGIADLIIAKQRNGPTGSVKLRWWSGCTRFDNLAEGEWDDAYD